MGQPRPTRRRRLPVKLAMARCVCDGSLPAFQAMTASTANSGRVCSQARMARARPCEIRNCAASAPQAMTNAERRMEGKVQIADNADVFSIIARAAAGAILHVPIADVTVQQLLESRRPLLYADMRGETTAPAKTDILVLGSEGSGVSEEIRGHGKPIGIKTSGRVESLNVAAAAAILLWQAFR